MSFNLIFRNPVLFRTDWVAQGVWGTVSRLPVFPLPPSVLKTGKGAEYKFNQEPAATVASHRPRRRRWLLVKRFIYRGETGH